MAPDAFVRIDDQRSLRGMRVVIPEHRFLRVSICPARGARVLRYEQRADGTDVRWDNPRIERRPVPIGARSDDSLAGGWRGISTLALEPCTTVPQDLVDAPHAGSSRHPDADESLECEVRAVLFEGREPLCGFTDDGKALR